MPGRYPDNLNLYPWMQDINWQPNRTRPRSSRERMPPLRSESLQFLYDFSQLFMGANGKFATVFPHEESIILFSDGVTFEVIPTQNSRRCELLYTNPQNNHHSLTYYNNTFSLPPTKTPQLKLPLLFESGTFYPFYCKDHPDDKDDRVIFVVEPYN